MTPQRYSGGTHDLLAENDRFRLKDREGQVVEINANGYLVKWEPPLDDPGRFELGILSRETTMNANSFGRLVVLERPDEARPTDTGDGRINRSCKELSREKNVRAHCVAAAQLIQKGRLRDARSDFVEKRKLISKRARKIYSCWEEVDKPQKPVKRRSGTMIPHVPLETVCGFQTVTNGRWIFNKYRLYAEDQKKKVEGQAPDVLFDNYRNCGHAPYHCDEVMDIICAVVSIKLDEERVTAGKIVESVRAVIRQQNSLRLEDFERGLALKEPGYAAVRNVIHAIAPVEHAIRTRGKKAALSGMHSVGCGVVTNRVLQRVEIDECKCDLMILLTALGLYANLTDDEKKALGLDGRRRRVIISMAIDVHTRSIVGLKIVPEGAANPLRDTIEMIYLDKKPITDALGCQRSWVQGGKTSAIVLDRGAKYITDEAYQVLASLRICNLGAPAGKAWLRPFIERVFRTLNEKFVTYFSGRTFSNVVKRGENDAAARASVTLEDFCFWLVRWIVDLYHETPHEGLDWITPNQAWEQATSLHRPVQFTSAEMRKHFGTRIGTYKVRQNGITVGPIVYMDEDFARLRLERRLDAAEVIYWEGDVGGIEVKIGHNEWTFICARDEKWIGATHSDVKAYVARKKAALAASRPIREAGIRDLDGEGQRLRVLHQLSAPRMSEEQLRANIEDFSRFATTAAGRYDAPDYDDFLDGEIGDDDDDIVDMTVDSPVRRSGATTAPTRPASPKQNAALSDDDLME
ncbi:hypothetical protein [Jannaschia formosa]|uniref:hypothetical protein n=1 Tax=Jannaschia formosa TaxID=2259592 RepID=UPI00107570AA|nr:hypothetical protein [Jannaschia formosa]TFL18459.1 hypothetical protein DR046_10230 [Jannaschia formosa]